MNDALEVCRPVERAIVVRAAELAARPVAANTARAYAADWRTFAAWCAGHGLPALPADERTIVLYLTHLEGEGKRYATIARAYRGIRARHAADGSGLPTLDAVRNVLSGIGREHGTASRGKSPLMANDLRCIVAGMGDDPLDVRDRAMLLVCWAAALRRSELVALDVSDLVFSEDGLAVHVRRGKTDQRGEGRVVGVPHGTRGSCPVRACRAWLASAGATDGPAFRPIGGTARLAGAAVDRAVKRAVARIGLDPDAYGAHSLRAGLATSAAKAGKGLDVIMRTTGHKSERIAMGYIRFGSVFDGCASEGLL